MSHLSEETLNEYLDNALAPSARDEAAAHLASCSVCTAELDALRSLFSTIESLPDVPLIHNLAPAVVAQLPIRVLVPRSVRWALIAQGLVALGLLASLWPLVDFSLLRLPTVSLNLPSLEQLAPLWQFSFKNISIPALPVDLPTFAAILLLVGVFAFWLLGNGLLLVLPRFTLLTRRPL